MCEWKASKQATLQYGVRRSAASPPTTVVSVGFVLHSVIKRVDFPPLLVCSLCGCVYLQVVGMDADQRPLSRGDPAGEGQGSQPGGPEGPEGRLGATESLGRKLPGEKIDLLQRIK